MVGYSDSGKDGGYLAAHVGDLPRAGGARRTRGGARCRADAVPGPRWGGRPRRRPGLRGDPRPAARGDRRPAEADRAGRDDLVQVRAAGARGAEPRGRRSRRRCSRSFPREAGIVPPPDGRPRRPGRAGRRRRRRRTGTSSGGTRAFAAFFRASRRSTSSRSSRSARGPSSRPEAAADGDRRAPRDPVGVLVDAEPLSAAGLVRVRHGVLRVRHRRASGCAGCGASIASGRSSGRWSRTSR